MAPDAPFRIFLLSPASCGGKRAALLFSERAEFDLARRMREGGGAPLGEVFAFLSGLYFRGKIAYARRFARPPEGVPGIFVITPNDGLETPEKIVDLTMLRRYGEVDIHESEARYRRPLEKDLRRLAKSTGEGVEFVLLGSVATGKYVDILVNEFAGRLRFPRDFVGRGDMSRGGLMLRCADEPRELEYIPVQGAVRTGVRPPKLPKLTRKLGGYLVSILLAHILTATAARAEDAPEPTGWEAFAEKRSGNCVGPPGDLGEAIELTAGKHTYKLLGHRLIQTDQDRDKILRIGVVSALKDDRPETLQAIKHVFAVLKRKKIDVLLANGDLATDEFQMETVFPALADSGVLVVAITGNTESCGSFNKIAVDTFKSHRNFINGNWVRRIELDDGTLITVPGYYDRRFVHTGGASVYTSEDLNALVEIARGAAPPLIIVSHGPPKMSGKKALDVATDVGNVGDPGLTDLIKDLKIPFGVFGHILEAGGRGTDLTGKKPLKPKKWAKELYVNAGTLNPDPWKMLDGKSSYGMALYVEVEKKRARYEVLRMPKPKD